MSSTMSSPEDTDAAENTGPYFRQSRYRGKGRGMQATRKIPRGTPILEEAPLLHIVTGRVDLFQESLFWGAGEYSGGPAVLQEVNKLSSEDHVKFLQLTYDTKKSQEWLDSHERKRGSLSMDEWACLSRLARNAFDATEDDADRFGNGQKTIVVFHRISFFNHSCKPNAVWKWHPERKCGMVHALKEIAAGDQIYLNYLPSLDEILKSRKDRRTTLEDHWGFNCTCTGCTLSADACEAEDAQRKRALRDWKILINLPRPIEAVPMEQQHLDTLTWPDDSDHISLTAEANIQCKGKDMVALHREHRRMVAYFESVTEQFEALELDHPDIYHRRAIYHLDWVRRPGKAGQQEDCKSCQVKTHARYHLKAALAAYDKEIELDIICYGPDHPVTAATMRKCEDARRKKAQHHSPKLR